MGGASGSLAAAIQGADEKLTVLDDRVDAEDVATFLWMSAHKLVGHMHPRVAIGTERLSFAWDARKQPFHDAASAEMYLNDFSHDSTAVRTFHTIERTLNFGAPLPISEHAVVATVAAGLASGRVWLIELPRTHPPSRLISKTSPEVFAAINARFGTKVDFDFVAVQEGGQWLRGYVPMNKGKVMGQSGMTVATGFDLGQWESTQVKKFGFSIQLLNKVLPYTSNRFKGMTKTQVIQRVMKLGPIPELTKSEADICDGAVFGYKIEEASNLWNKFAKHGVASYKALPGGWQTVWLSRIYQEGAGQQHGNALVFRSSALSGNWQLSIASLRAYTNYGSRILQEADLLARELPGPVSSI